MEQAEILQKSVPPVEGIHLPSLKAPPPPSDITEGGNHKKQQQRQTAGGSNVSRNYSQPQQTTFLNWMPPPKLGFGVPPGLHYLDTLDQLLVEQNINFFEIISDFEQENTYKIKNNQNQVIFFAVEDSELFTRNCFRESRPFDMRVLDNSGAEVMHFYRPYRCSLCCFPGFLQVLEATAPVGDVVGYVVQEWNPCMPRFTIRNENYDIVLRIYGPFFTFSCGFDVIFQVMSKDGSQEVGAIRKRWGGFLKEFLTTADNFGITFPVDLNVRMKAVMLGACFLIDYLYYETKTNRERGGHRHRRRHRHRHRRNTVGWFVS